MKASISAWSYRSLIEGDGAGMDLLSFVDEAKRQGADGFEIFPSYVDAARRPEHLKEVMAKAKSLGLEVSSLIAGNDFARPRAQERAEQVGGMKRWIEAAAAAGIPRMNVFTGYHQPGQDPTMETMRVIDSYREVMPLAEELGITLCIENHSSVHPDADGILAIIRAVGSDRLRTNPDPTNFVPGFTQRDDGAREAVYLETEKVAPLMANAHIKVNTFDAEGNAEFVDVARVLSIFRAAGYDEHVVLEYYGSGDPRESMRQGVAQLKRLFAA